MSTINIQMTIDTSNAVFEEYPGEVAETLKRVMARIASATHDPLDGGATGAITDANGNTVGRYNWQREFGS
jgi:hypothetical protein